MKRIKIFLFFFTSLFISSCSDENITNPIDSELSKNIIGTWKGNSHYSITFLSNGFFIDSTYFLDNPDTSFNSYGLLVRNGKYNISNSALTLSDCYVSDFITGASIGMGFLSQSAEISINNNTLKRKKFTVFDNIGNNRKELWDKWETIGWYCQANTVDSSQNSYGTYKQIYYFVEDSSQFSHTSIYHNLIDDSTYTYETKRNFTYNPPYLDLPAEADYNVLVQFKNNKMYWYYEVMLEDLVKVR
jgi:hypothetical protein